MYEHGKKAEPSAKTETKAPSKAAASPNPMRQPAWTNALGSQPVPALQPKLTVNQPGDEYEQEADRVAAQVMRMASPAVTQVQRCACGGIAGPDGECASCKAKRLGVQRQTEKPEEKKEKPSLQRKITVTSSSDQYEEETDQTANQVAHQISQPAPQPNAPQAPAQEEEQPLAVQRKLTINQSGNKYEQEADHVAAQVMRSTSSSAPSAHSPVPEEEEEEKPALQAKLANDHVMRASSSATPPTHSPVPEEEEEKPALQAKLTINQPGDQYEQEADRVAARVMRAASSSAPPTHSPAPEDEEEEKPALQAKRANDHVMRATSSATPPPTHSPAPEEEKPALQTKAASPSLQRKPSGDASPAEAPPSVHETLRSSGQPLEDSTRARMERSFGQDFSGVQVHTGEHASRSSADIGALAYTVGEHVVFGAGQYTPGTRQGDTLIAHELTHTVQQRGGSFSDGPFNDLSPVQRLPDVTYLQMANIPGWVIDMMPGALEPLARDIDKAGGIFAYIEKILGNVVNRIFGGLKHSANTVADLIDNFTKLYVSVGKIGAAIASGNRERFAQAVTDLASALQSIIGHGWDALESLLGPVGNFLDGVVQTLDQPPEQGIKNFAGDIWTSVINIGRTIWNLVHDSGIPGVGLAWDSIRSWLGITGPDTYDSVIHWIEGKASEVWGAIKSRLSGVLSTVRDTATTIRKVISVENIRSMREEVDEWIIHVRDTVIALNGDDGNGVASKQSILRNVLIPAIKSGAESVRKLIIEAGSWVAGLIAGLATKIKNFITNAGANPFLSVVPELFDWVTKAVDDLSSWAQKTVIGLFNAAGDGIVRLSEFVEPVLDTLINLASTTVDLVANLPNLLTAAWNAIPAWIREPIKKFVLQQVLGRIPIFKQLMDDPSIWERAKAVAMRILQQIFVDGDLMGAAWTFFQSLLDLLHFPSKLVVQIVEKATKVFKQIFNDPLSFFKNLLSAVKKGFSNFFDHIGKHLLNGLSRWLFGQAAKAGIKPPADLSLGSILQFVLDLLGINMEMIWERLALKIGAERVAQIRKAIDILTGAWEWISLAVTKGPGALWEKLQEKISELWNKVIDGAVSWITQTLIEKAITKVLSMLDPTGIMAVVNSAIAIYNAVESFIEYVTEMLEIVNKVLDGIQEIANGVLDTAATFLENALADGLPVAIGFLANQVGLGKIGEKLGEIIQTVREYVIKGIDWLIDKALQLGGKALDSLGIGGKKQDQPAKTDNPKEDLPEYKFEADHESHRIWVKIENGHLQPVISSQTETLKEWLAKAKENPKINKDKARMALIPIALQTLEKFDAEDKRIEEGKKSGKEMGPYSTLLNLETELGKLCAKIVGALPISEFDERYKLEGIVAKYADMPRQTGDKITPDHQPQAASLKHLASKKVFKGRKVVKAAGGRHADGGWTINTHHIRHIEGRTYGISAGYLRKQIDEAVRAESDDDSKRNAAINILKAELKADVEEMREIIALSETDAVWADINQSKDIPDGDKKGLIEKVKKQLNAGEDRIANQNLDELKEPE